MLKIVYRPEDEKDAKEEEIILVDEKDKPKKIMLILLIEEILADIGLIFLVSKLIKYIKNNF